MPKTDTPLTKAKTSPGVSYTVPAAKLVDTAVIEDSYAYVIALDALEEALLDAAAREVIDATVPGYAGSYDLPVITWKGRTCLRVAGQFPPTLKGPDGKPRKLVRAGATVTVRAMLKCWPTAEGLTVVAYPSRIDVHGKDPVQAPAGKAKTSELSQLDMNLVQPAAVGEPAPISRPKPRKTTKPKPAPKTKAALAAERALIVQSRMRARAAMQAAEVPKPAPKAKTKATPPPSNVIVFPVHRTRKPSRP